MYHRCASWTIRTSSSSSNNSRRYNILSVTTKTNPIVTTPTKLSLSFLFHPRTVSASVRRSVVFQMFSSSSSSTGTGTTGSINSPNNSRRVVLHWFRENDLRLLDNPALMHSTSLLATSMPGMAHQQDIIIPIYCFDTTRLYGNQCHTYFDQKLIKCSPRRAQFLLESVIDLRQQLQEKCHSELIVACGNPATIFHHIIDYIKKNYTNNIRIVCQEEVASEEIQVTKDVRQVIKRHFPSINNEKLIYEMWGSTMYERMELPYDRNVLYHMPDVFTPFRNDVEKKCVIHKPFAIPNYLPFPHTDWPKELTFPPTSNILPTTSNDETTTTTDTTTNPIIASTTYMPTLLDLGYTEEQVLKTQQHDPRSFSHIFKGGATAGMARVQEYIWEQDLLQNYFDTRNGMIGADYSTKFSPWLAHGCISPRMIVAECQKYERIRVKNKSTYWVVFELLWRDFCKFFLLKHAIKIFRPHGILSPKDPGMTRKWNNYEPALEAWKEGKTGFPLVDANMREMKATGFMSNRGRQNVASFLALDLQYDWRYGGDWFESNLIDYDVYSNWVNWCSAAGLTGGRINRFNIVKQSRDYDQYGEYIKLWIPELKNVPVPYVHEPWKMTQFQQIEFNCHLGLDYPNPIIPPTAYNAIGAPGSGRGEESRNSSGGGGGKDNNNNNKTYKDGRYHSSQRDREKQRKPNKSDRNRHQKYEMTGLKEGNYNFDE